MEINTFNGTDLPDFKADFAIPLAALCELCGISTRSGQRLVQDGVFVSSGKAKGRNKSLYPLKENLLRYWSMKMDELRTKLQPDGGEDLKKLKLKAEIALKDSQGELHQLKTEIAKGNYISTEEVAVDYQRFFLLFKKFAMAIPARVGGYIAGYLDPIVERGIEQDLQREINSMLRNFVVAGQTPPEAADKK